MMLKHQETQITVATLTEDKVTEIFYMTDEIH